MSCGVFCNQALESSVQLRFLELWNWQSTIAECQFTFICHATFDGVWSPRPQTISPPAILSPGLDDSSRGLVGSSPNVIHYKCQFNKCICWNVIKLNLPDNRFTFHDLSKRTSRALADDPLTQRILSHKPLARLPTNRKKKSQVHNEVLKPNHQFSL